MAAVSDNVLDKKSINEDLSVVIANAAHEKSTDLSTRVLSIPLKTTVPFGKCCGNPYNPSLLLKSLLCGPE